MGLIQNCKCIIEPWQIGMHHGLHTFCGFLKHICMSIYFRTCTFTTFGKASITLNWHVFNWLTIIQILYICGLPKTFPWLFNLFLKSRRISKSLDQILQSIGKFAKPGARIKDYSVYNEAELWRDVCKDLEVPNTLVNRLKICKATAHLWKVFSVT